MKTLVSAAAMALALSAAAAPAALAQTASMSSAPAHGEALARAPTFNLSAYGETRVAPDKASISLGVMTEAPTAAAAMSANATRMTQVIAALKRGGIAERDIQTSGLSLNPQYVYEPNASPRLTGYQASNQVTITVRDLSTLGRAVDATVNAGANQVHGISFGLTDPTAAEDAARLAAVRALQAKADLYAKATGHRVVRLIQLSEGGSYAPPPPPMPAMAMARMEKADSTPVSPGEMTVRVDVSGVYEVAR
jgi:uncharacterized protein